MSVEKKCSNVDISRYVPTYLYLFEEKSKNEKKRKKEIRIEERRNNFKKKKIYLKNERKKVRQELKTRRMNDNSNAADGARRDVKSMDHIPAELVREVLEYLFGQELPFALTCKSNWTHVNLFVKTGFCPYSVGLRICAAES